MEAVTGDEPTTARATHAPTETRTLTRRERRLQRRPPRRVDALAGWFGYGLTVLALVFVAAWLAVQGVTVTPRPAADRTPTSTSRTSDVRPVVSTAPPVTTTPTAPVADPAPSTVVPPTTSTTQPIVAAAVASTTTPTTAP